MALSNGPDNIWERASSSYCFSDEPTLGIIIISRDNFCEGVKRYKRTTIIFIGSRSTNEPTVVNQWKDRGIPKKRTIITSLLVGLLLLWFILRTIGQVWIQHQMSSPTTKRDRDDEYFSVEAWKAHIHAYLYMLISEDGNIKIHPHHTLKLFPPSSQFGNPRFGDEIFMQYYFRRFLSILF